MRKFLACSIVALGVFALAACGGGGGGGGGSADAFCKEAAKSWETVRDGGSIDLTDDDALDDAVAASKALASKAPKEIKDEANDFKEFADGYVKAIKKAGDDEGDREDAANEYGGKNGEKYSDAAAKVDDFIQSECDGSDNTDNTDESDDTDFNPDDSSLSEDCEEYASSFDLPADYCDLISDLPSDLSDLDLSDFDLSDMLSDFSSSFSGN